MTTNGIGEIIGGIKLVSNNAVAAQSSCLQKPEEKVTSGKKDAISLSKEAQKEAQVENVSKEIVSLFPSLRNIPQDDLKGLVREYLSLGGKIDKIEINASDHTKFEFKRELYSDLDNLEEKYSKLCNKLPDDYTTYEDRKVLLEARVKAERQYYKKLELNNDTVEQLNTSLISVKILIDRLKQLLIMSKNARDKYME